MGSPYNCCEIKLVGYNKIVLPRLTWQDKYAWSNDSTKLVLIRWSMEDNEPAFRFFIINIETGSFKESHQIAGCVNSLSVGEDRILYNKFLYDKSKTTQGSLCCNVDEEYQIN
jgi:hypothetical protein